MVKSTVSGKRNVTTFFIRDSSLVAGDAYSRFTRQMAARCCWSFVVEYHRAITVATTTYHHTTTVHLVNNNRNVYPSHFSLLNRGYVGNKIILK